MTRPNPPEVPPGVGNSGPHAEEPRLRPAVLIRWGAFASLGVLATLAAAAAVYTARAVLIRTAIALFVAISLDPAVRWLVRKGMRRGLAVTIIFVIALAMATAFLMSVIPAMVSQFRGLVQDLPGYLTQLQDRSSRFRELSDRFNLTKQIQSIISTAPSRLGSGLFGFTGRVFGALFSMLTVLVLSIYFMADLPRLRNGLVRLFPRARRSQLGRVADVVIDKVGAYMIGNLLISLVAGLAAFVCFTALKVPFSVPLAFVVALTDLIPMIGATLGAIIAVVLTLFASELWPTTVLVALFFVVYQQLENYLIAPRILRSTVNLSAAAVLVAGLIGATALGLVGALMAIPVAAAMRVLLTERLQARDAAEAKSDTGPAVTGLAALDRATAGEAEPDDGSPPEERDEVHTEAEARQQLRPSEDEAEGTRGPVTSRESAGGDRRSPE
jgi:predicted PurR-regulated permease PerM